MIEPVNYWISVIGYLTLVITAFTKLFEALEELMNHLPKWLKIAAKFLTYSVTLVVPNIGIIWYFFYLAGFSPNRFSEARFFWAMVAQPTLAVSLYAFIWGKWLYPRLQRILGDSPSQQPPEKKVVDPAQSKRAQDLGEKRPRPSSQRRKSPRPGGKKG